MHSKFFQFFRISIHSYERKKKEEKRRSFLENFSSSSSSKLLEPVSTRWRKTMAERWENWDSPSMIISPFTLDLKTRPSVEYLNSSRLKLFFHPTEAPRSLPPTHPLRYLPLAIIARRRSGGRRLVRRIPRCASSSTY